MPFTESGSRRPNQSVERTAARRTLTFQVTRTSSLRAPLALGGGRSFRLVRSMRAVVLIALLACALPALPSRPQPARCHKMLALYSCSPPRRSSTASWFESLDSYVSRSAMQFTCTARTSITPFPECSLGRCPGEPRREPSVESTFLLEGTFDASDHGHMGLFGGAIRKITRMSAWHDGKL